ncbi:hypothetical protein NMG60_11032815 [Bertholletia excelsa]
MAHLPPKVPSLAPNWVDFPHQRMASLENLAPTAAAAQNPSWVDEFLDFAAVKRGSHRRSVSDSVAFVEPEKEFERFDDEQLMSMFTDEMAVPPTVSSSNTSTPSDHNSINEDKPAPVDQQHYQKSEAEEVQSSCKPEPQSAADVAMDNSTEKIIDPKRVKRILANRQSAQRSRVRKLQYISELERSVTSLQAEVSVLSPRVAFFDHQRLILNIDNSALKQRIAALAQDKIFKDAHQEGLKREIERLRKVYEEQIKKVVEKAGHPSQPPPSTDAGGSAEDERFLN